VALGVPHGCPSSLIFPPLSKLSALSYADLLLAPLIRKTLFCLGAFAPPALPPLPCICMAPTFSSLRTQLALLSPRGYTLTGQVRAAPALVAMALDTAPYLCGHLGHLSFFVCLCVPSNSTPPLGRAVRVQRDFPVRSP
jgi:hypothetical protein